MIRNILALVGGASAGFAVTSAMAAPRDWEWTFQPAATDMMRQITWFQDYTLWFIVPITILVMVLLGYCMFRFSAKRNPVPSQTTHNTLIEVIWTVLPVVVLIAIAIPSFQLLTAQYNPKDAPKLTVKATGNQWNWDYEYETGDKDKLSFNSSILADADRASVVHAHPRTEHFKEDIIDAFYNGIRHKPDTTFGNVKADVIADKEPHFHRGNFCSVIRQSAWKG